MAGGIVSYVLGKLAEVAIQEALFLYKVTDKADVMKRELKRIECFLEDADTKPKGDKRVQNWVKEIRDVAFKIEDAFDTFLVNIGNPPDHKKPRKRDFVKRMLKMTAKLPALHDYGKELDDIKALIDEIFESNKRYGVVDLGEGGSKVKGPVRRYVIPEIDTTVVVGFEVHKKAIIEQLLDENTSRRSMVSVVGQGGLGKTTLAVKVYNSFCPADFDIKIWVTVSEQFKLIDLLRKMLEKINSISPEELQKGEDNLISKLYTSLQNKKYLIVLDDVWTEDLWKQIQVALPDDDNKSRVLVTSRFANVAKAADPMNEPYELPLLNHTESLNLLLKMAIPKNERREDLSDLANKFANKCGGLPLALVVLGGFLSTKSPTYIVWDKVYQTMKWQAEGRECAEIITTSYADLSYVLKSCFMYFALFPEDYKINAKFLIRMWVAEGFIPEEDNRTMEDTAEGYLEELVQRSMVQVVKRNHTGSIKYCHIHDLLRDLAIRKANECNFISVLLQDDNHTGLNTVRRVANHSSQPHEQMQHINPNLRTLFCFESVPNCSRFKLLRVLEMSQYLETPFDNLLGLTQLRYFARPYSGTEDPHPHSFESITNMKNVQTIDLSRMDYCNIPDCLWDVKILRHVILPKKYCGGPPGTADLKYLQTLINASVQKSWYENLPNLPNLRELVISVREPNQHKMLAAFLSRLDHLVSLTIKKGHAEDNKDSSEKEIYKMSDIPSFQHMHSLCLDGVFSPDRLTFDTNLFPTHITNIKLLFSGLELDPMPVLEKLNNLKKLHLRKAYTGKEMTCLAGGFTQLKHLTIHNHFDLEKWVIMEGAMPVLQKLALTWCHNVRIVGLNQVATLQEFKWDWPHCPSDDQEKMSEEIQNQTKHVPIVNIIGFKLLGLLFWISHNYFRLFHVCFFLLLAALFVALFSFLFRFCVFFFYQ